MTMDGYVLPQKGKGRTPVNNSGETEVERRKRLQYEAMMNEVGDDDDGLEESNITKGIIPPPSSSSTTFINGAKMGPPPGAGSRGRQMLSESKFGGGEAKSSTPTNNMTPAYVPPPSEETKKESWDSDSDREERAAVEKEFGKSTRAAKEMADRKNSKAGDDSDDDDETVRKRMLSNAIKPFLFDPAKKGAKVTQCYVVREKTGFTRQNSLYRVYLEDGNRFLFSAKKRSKNKTTNFIISSDENPPDDRTDTCIGKVRGNFSGSNYTMFDHGMNPEKAVTDVTLRRELGSIIFSYDKMGPGKMFAAIPDIADNGIPSTWKPRDEEGRIATAMEANRRDRLIFLQNKRPKWDEQAQGHVLNFHGRVTKSSVKNFQLSSEITGDTTVLQFGRTEKNRFTMDFCYPLSPLQAFGICLASLDDKLADSKGWETMAGMLGSKK